MPRVYSRICNKCHREYRGEGKYFCSKECANTLRVHGMGTQSRHQDLIRRAFDKGLGVLGSHEFAKWFEDEKKECYYCGICEEMLTQKLNLSLQIDRMNPAVGYYIDNIALACPMCNKVKSDVLTSDEMKEVAMKYIVNKYEVICGR